ncbi:sigma-54-dependent Fis family transcriptional regulator [Spirochaetia bacterium]|nr:sigma-54-dependent Fis family transcriptional regulator [Spirochaetia bacterium]
MNKILVIDDERSIRSSMSDIIEDEGYAALVAEDAPAGIEIISKEKVDLVFLDVMLPKMNGIEALGEIKKRWPDVEVVVMSGHAETLVTAVKAVKLGAFDYMEKPLSIDKILTICRNAFAMIALRKENVELKSTASGTSEIIGESLQIEQVRSLIKQAAGSDARILITGENGSGKELVARAVHKLSKRAKMPFVEVNCAAIPDSLIESELFGHEKGAFTDAASSRRGRFELASGGTLFLDEIGDMSLNAQAKVLRAIQEQQIERVGGEKVIDVDLRVVAATNKNLEAAVKDGNFRQDLFFRLNVIPIHMPALRERPDDIEILLQYFLKENCSRVFTFENEALSFLKAYPWHGNVRELKNIAERIAILCDDESVNLNSLKLLFDTKDDAAGTLNAGQNQIFSDILELSYNQAKELFERCYLKYQFEKNGNALSRTAEAIGMYPGNLSTKLKKYGIDGNKL